MQRASSLFLRAEKFAYESLFPRRPILYAFFLLFRHDSQNTTGLFRRNFKFPAFPRRGPVSGSWRDKVPRPVSTIMKAETEAEPRNALHGHVRRKCVNMQ